MVTEIKRKTVIPRSDRLSSHIGCRSAERSPAITRSFLELVELHLVNHRILGSHLFKDLALTVD